MLRALLVIVILSSVISSGAGLPVAAQDSPDPYALVSQDSMFAYLEDLTAIQPYSGWRNSATTGESEALDYVAHTLSEFDQLQAWGLELERESFHVFAATEIWESRLFLTVQGQEIEVPADAPRGHRHDVQQALRFDSDGVLNDADPNPVEASGAPLLIRTAGDVLDLTADDVQGRIVFLDYAAIDPRIKGVDVGVQVATMLLAHDIAGLVLVTEFRDMPGTSHGALLGDGTILERVTTDNVPPALYVRLEDLSPAGISTWDDLDQIEAARMIWDTDVFAPGTSQNLVARIPGVDSSQAVILGAHLDSANSPGAMDNGINSVALLEVARVLDAAQMQPAVDVVLVWFGSEELWVYGSQYFVTTHQELLDRTLAAFVMDGIIVSTPGPLLTLDGWSHSRFGNDQLTVARFIEQQAAARGIVFDSVDDFQGIGSDNGVFSGFVPQTGFAFGSPQGGYAHSPYDTVEVAGELGDLMEQVATAALIAALEIGAQAPDLHVTPAPTHRAVLVASHTEVVHMTTTLIELDRALAWAGFDVDMIPYGQPVTAEALADADLVIVLPVIDYPSPAGDLTIYDDAWHTDEIAALGAYVDQGGLLVLTNSANRIVFGFVFDANDDLLDQNALAEQFGIVYQDAPLFVSAAQIAEEHPLTDGQTTLLMIEGNGVSFTMNTGILGIAGFGPPEQDNFAFWRNLAAYASDRSAGVSD